MGPGPVVVVAGNILNEEALDGGALNGGVLNAVVLVEGESDRVATQILAARSDLDLSAAGIVVISIGGAQAVGRCLRQLSAQAPHLRRYGLCDRAEVAEIQRGLAGLEHHPSTIPQLAVSQLDTLGFFVCDRDLEDELIRAVGTDTVMDLIAAQQESRAFRSFASQPAWREKPLHDQLHRFMGTKGGRKVRMAKSLCLAVEQSAVPRPLRRLLDRLVSDGAGPLG